MSGGDDDHNLAARAKKMRRRTHAAQHNKSDLPKFLFRAAAIA